MCLLWKLGAGDLAKDFNMDAMGKQFSVNEIQLRRARGEGVELMVSSD